MCAQRVVLAQGRRPGGDSLPWLVLGEHALPLRYWAAASSLGVVASVTDLVENWSRHESTLHTLTTSVRTQDVIRTEGIATHSLLLDAPIRPRQVFCAIGNYERQIVEAAVDAGDGPDGPGAENRRRAALDGVRRRRETGDPYVCLTSSARVAAPSGTLQLPHDSLDWEVEIAAVVKAHVPRGGSVDTRSVIAGYCTANDLTIRTRVVRDDVAALGSDWIQSKGAPGTLPLGPWFVPAWQIPDVAALRLRLWVNGQLMQDDFGSDMVFGIERLVSYLSRHTQLHAGDVICTGSPAGFGAHHGRFLRGGDELIAEVSELGRQRLTFVGAASSAVAVQGELTPSRTRIR